MKKKIKVAFAAFIRLMTKSSVWQRLTNAEIFFVLFFVDIQRYVRGKERKKAITVG